MNDRLNPPTNPIERSPTRRAAIPRCLGSIILVYCLLTLTSGCFWNKRPPYTLPPEADIARSAAYSAPPPASIERGHPPVSHLADNGSVFYPQAPAPLDIPPGADFQPAPNYFPDDEPLWAPAPEPELAPAPLNIDPGVQQMSGVYCCQRCQSLTEDLESMSQRVDELTAMMEAQRLTVESLNAALLRADANITQLTEDLAWYRGELTRMRAETEEQQQRDVERLQEIAEIVERLSAAP